MASNAPATSGPETAHEHDHDSPEYIKKQIPVYLSIGVALLALTFFTVYVSTWDMSHAAHIYMALAIAAVKGSLVAAYFMHLIDEKKIIYAMLILTVFMFFAAMFGPMFTEGGKVGDTSWFSNVEPPAITSGEGHH